MKRRQDLGGQYLNYVHTRTAHRKKTPQSSGNVISICIQCQELPLRLRIRDDKWLKLPNFYLLFPLIAQK